MNYHLAQLNIALARDEMTSDTMSVFVSRLDEINSLAEQSAGFVWRLKDESAGATDATAIDAFDNPLILVNMSVWESLDALKQFVYKSVHVDLIRDRDAWFHKMPEMHQALWWVPAGFTPTIADAQSRLAHIRAHGSTEYAFTFAKNFPAPTAD